MSVGKRAKEELSRLAVRLMRRFYGLRNKRHAHKLNGVKYVHLMFNDKFNKPFVDFLNSHFDPRKHLVLCKRRYAYPFPTGENVLEVKSFAGFDFSRDNLRGLIFHSLFDDEMIDLLWNHKEYLRKSDWIVWGNDFYGAPRDEKNNYVRSNFRYYVADPICESVRERYNAKARFIHCVYLFPLSREILDKPMHINKHKKPSSVLVQINNSCDPSTIQVLESLAHFSDKDIAIRTINSYGKTEYKNAIVKCGRKIFGDKFESVDKYMAPNEYAMAMKDVDIFILNQPRTQGFGNILAFLYLGKKVYIRSDVEAYGFLMDNSVIVHDTKTLAGQKWDDFVLTMNCERNIQFAAERLDVAFLADEWKALLEA